MAHFIKLVLLFAEIIMPQECGLSFLTKKYNGANYNKRPASAAISL